MMYNKYFIILSLFFSFIFACAQDNKPENTKGDMDMIINLPEPNMKGTKSLEESLVNRRSIRSYKDEPLLLEEVSQLLWAAYGITKPLAGAPPFLRGGLRTAPSAGALYPLEIYIMAGDVQELKQGIYHYNSENHTLKLISSGDFRKAMCTAALEQLMLENAPATIIYSAIFERTTGKYGQRGRDRYVCMDLGHSAQNVCLQATVLGLGACAVGAFHDDSVKKLVGMSKDEEALYLIPVGRTTK